MQNIDDKIQNVADDIIGKISKERVTKSGIHIVEKKGLSTATKVGAVLVAAGLAAAGCASAVGNYAPANGIDQLVAVDAPSVGQVLLQGPSNLLPSYFLSPSQDDVNNLNLVLNYINNQQKGVTPGIGSDKLFTEGTGFGVEFQTKKLIGTDGDDIGFLLSVLGSNSRGYQEVDGVQSADAWRESHDVSALLYGNLSGLAYRIGIADTGELIQTRDLPLGATTFPTLTDSRNGTRVDLGLGVKKGPGSLLVVYSKDTDNDRDGDYTENIGLKGLYEAEDGNVYLIIQNKTIAEAVRHSGIPEQTRTYLEIGGNFGKDVNGKKLDRWGMNADLAIDLTHPGFRVGSGSIGAFWKYDNGMVLDVGLRAGEFDLGENINRSNLSIGPKLYIPLSK